MADAVDKEIDALGGGPFFEVEVQAEEDAGAAVHTPEEHADAVFRRLGKAEIPEPHLPVEGPAFDPERRIERPAVGPVALGHVGLEMVAGDDFVVDGGAGEMDIVAAEAHELGFVRYFSRGEADDDLFAAEEEGVDALFGGGHPAHAPDVFGVGGNRDEVAFFEEIEGFEDLIADEGGLLAGGDVEIFDVFERFFPIVLEAEFAGGF